MFALFTAFSLHPHVDTAVRATLADGQVLMGEVKTRALRLMTGAGLVEVPLADVGEVVPAGSQLGIAEGQVNLWLRNGSELRGAWSDPELAMSILVGGGKVGVNLPMTQLTRFQLKGREAWPQGPVYRLRTAWGDDVLVDPSRTRLQVENQLGSFAPALSECLSVAPIDDPEGDWRIALSTGTVLVGHLKDAQVTVALPMGPKELTVPLEQFVSLRMESWAPVPAYAPPVRHDDVGVPTYPIEADEVAQPVALTPGGTPTRAPALRQQAAGAGQKQAAGLAAPRQADEWFDRGELDRAKDAQGQ